MSLYKYLSACRTGMLDEGLIRFTQPGAFNDPFEMQPFFQSLAPDDHIEQQFLSEGESILKAEYGNLPLQLRSLIPYEFIQQYAAMKQQETLDGLKHLCCYAAGEVNQAVLPAFDRKIGILSLTEKHDNLLMWAHYADSHQGFVIQFDENHSFFSEKLRSHDALRQLRKIAYSHHRPNLTLSSVENIDVLLTKSDDWEYEQEWRMILPLEECNKRIPQTPYDICLFSLPPDVVKSVIMGCRLSPASKEEIRMILEKRPEYAHVRLMQAQLEKDIYGLSFQVVGI
jgi:hypothetical protein